MHRHARQARLADVGQEGQARIASATVHVPLQGLAGEVAARYLAGAGVAGVRMMSEELAIGPRAIDPRVLVEVDGSSPRTPPGTSLGIQDAAAQEVAEGALFALRALRRALQGAS
jgi:hypothetical protein